MTEARNEKVVKKFIGSIDRGYDLESAGSLIDDECEIIYPNLRRLDKQTYLRDLEYESSAFSDVSIKIDIILSEDTIVVTECSWKGVRTGEYRGIEPDNITYKAPGVFIFEVKKGKINIIKYYWNPALYT